MSSWLFRSIKSSPPTPALTQPTRRSPKQALLHYETSSPPPSARVDPKLKLQPRRPLRLWDYWKFGVIVAAKATEVTSDVVSHHIWGPRRQSWGIEMTIVTSLIRGAERHSALVDIGTIRMLMGLGGLVPLPSDAIVTPVSFHVKKRNLPGILSAYDAQESGTRELSGEWVVGRKTWQRRQSEWKAARKADDNKDGATTPELSTESPLPQTKERVVLYIHGGAYYLSSAAAQRIISIPLAKYTDSRVFALDYRLAPETCFPGPLHDAVTAYLRLVEELHIPPENIIVCGDSAGGGLSLALLMYLRDNAFAMPSGAILLSPWVDLTMSCESWETNAAYDVVPVPRADNHMNPIALYLGDRTEEYLTHPYASPLFGDFKGLPPLLIQAGDAEVLRDEIGLLAHKATLAGVEVRHELYDDAIHVFQAYPFLEASKKSFESMRYFVKTILPQKQMHSPKLLAAAAERNLEREIETDRAIVVGGDGTENPSSAPIAHFGERPFLALSTASGNDTPLSLEDGDDRCSWFRSPAWSNPRLPHQGSRQSEGAEVNHIEDVNCRRINDLHPSSSPSLISHHPSSMPPPTHNSSWSAVTSVSSSLSSSAASLVGPLASTKSFSGPRRIKSTNSLTSVAFQWTNSTLNKLPSFHRHSHSHSSHILPSPLHVTSAPGTADMHSWNKSLHSRSTTYLARSPSLTISPLSQPSPNSTAFLTDQRRNHIGRGLDFHPKPTDPHSLLYSEVVSHNDH